MDREYHRNWNKNNPDKKKAYNKKWYDANKDYFKKRKQRLKEMKNAE